MTKQLLTAAIAGSMALGAFADSSVVFTYADSNLDCWGKSKKESIDVAIRIDNPALAGKKITSVRALVNNGEGVEPLSLWLSSDLQLESKVNAPDICSMEPQVSEIAINDKWTVKQLEAPLENPYLLTDAPVYVGYSIDVTSIATNEEKYPVVVSYATNPDGFYLHASKSVLKWKNYTSTVDCTVAIYVTVEGDFAPCSLGLNAIPYSYAPVNQPYEVSAAVMNLGIEDIYTLDYTYTVGGETATGCLELGEPIKPDFVNPSKVMIPLEAIDALGIYDASLTIDKVNGKENVTNAPTASFQVDVIPFVPVHRPLVEEYTGTWCGWCTRGYLAMELLSEVYGNKCVGVAYHNGDPMTVTNNYPVSVSGFPSSTINRGAVVDPYYGNYNGVDFGISRDVEGIIDTFVNADLFLEAGWADEEKTELIVNTDARFTYDLDNLNCSVGYVLAADGLQNASWAQSNYYAGSSYGGYLAELCTWPSSVTGLVFNEVVIDMKATRGVAGSIPESVVAGGSNTSSYTFKVGDSFKNLSGTNVPIDKDKLFVAAFIIDKNTNKIVNANKIRTEGLGVMSGVKNVSADNDDTAPAEYFNLNGIKVANPENGIFIRRQGSQTSKVAL